MSPRGMTPDRGRTFALFAMAMACLVYASMAETSPLVTRAVMAVAVTLVLTAAVLGLSGLVRLRGRRIAMDMLDTFMSRDATPSFIVTEDGKICSRNPAAGKRYGDCDATTFADALRSTFANPPAVLFRLQSRAQEKGAAQEDIATRSGVFRLSAHQLDGDRYLWRIEDMPDHVGGLRAADGLPIPVLTVGRNNTVLYMNDAARTLVGERAKSLDTLFEQLPPRAGEINTLSTGAGQIQVLVSEFQERAGRKELYLTCLKDLASGPYEAAFETMPVALMKLARDGRILACNRGAMRLLGTQAADATMIGEVMQGLGRPIKDWLRETLNSGASGSSEFLRLSRDDREVFVQVTLTPIREGDDQALMAVLNDATELKTLEAQFVQSQKMQAIGQLAGGVAHDFNNLLTAISGHCDLLLLRHDQGDQDYGDLVQIHQNANRAAALVSQLLAFSRKQTLRPEVLDLRDTLSDLTHLLNRLVGEKVTLTLSHDPVLRAIRADKRQLEQVLMNLVVNARDAMPSGGEIRIETEGVSLPEPVERDRATVPPGDYVTVKVSDCGSGIPSDKLQKIFEPFYTTKRTGEGTGLGLSTVYGIVKQTGGYIFVDSTPGQGSVFTVYLPVHEEVQPIAVPKPAAPAITPPKHGEGVVLLVEDEAPVRAFASRALRLRGYTVLEAASAEDALKTLDDPDVNVDLFVTDVVMPGMDGPSWVRKALEVRPEVRVVFVSGYAEGALGDNNDVIPNSVFLPKPFSLSELAETVHRQLH
ncbi:MAG: hybrid sensor histidine kinase/response regulator [Rhodobacteraceae bacterium]|nr:hybrid sensor histidine kinase/response regulator [Paracoccaceae bacterium]